MDYRLSRPNSNETRTSKIVRQATTKREDNRRVSTETEHVKGQKIIGFMNCHNYTMRDISSTINNIDGPRLATRLNKWPSYIWNVIYVSVRTQSHYLLPKIVLSPFRITTYSSNVSKFSQTSDWSPTFSRNTSGTRSSAETYLRRYLSLSELLQWRSQDPVKTTLTAPYNVSTVLKSVQLETEVENREAISSLKLSTQL